MEQILDAAAGLVSGKGVDALSTRAIATAAAIPVASLYQYFSDKDAVLLALVERDTEEMDAQVRDDLAALTTLSVRGVVEATMRAYVKVFLRRPAFVEIWLRGRMNSAVQAYGRRHNRRTAAELYELARAAGMVVEDMPLAVAELAVEIGDRVFQLAFEHDLRGDSFLVEEGIEMVATYLERYATPEGLTGVPA